SQSHGDRRELPELRHQIRMRVGRKAGVLVKFLAEILKMLLVQSAFEKCARINSRSSVALEINHVPDKIISPSAKEMVKGDFVKCRCGRVGGNVAAEAAMGAVGIDDHGHGVPPHITLEAALHFPIAWERRLLLDRDGIDVRSAHYARGFKAFFAEAVS